MRLLKHLFARSARGLFPQDRLQRIAEAIARDELRHRGEVCFAVESALDLRSVRAGRQARDRAVEVFSRLRVWDTAEKTTASSFICCWPTGASKSWPTAVLQGASATNSGAACAC